MIKSRLDLGDDERVLRIVQIQVGNGRKLVVSIHAALGQVVRSGDQSGAGWALKKERLRMEAAAG
ncbi:hypothetical protein GCM10027425_05620 [Alteromonas gracilis]